VAWAAAGLAVIIEQWSLVDGAPPVPSLTIESVARNQEILKKLPIPQASAK
jgi:hypothetical protein